MPCHLPRAELKPSQELLPDFSTRGASYGLPITASFLLTRGLSSSYIDATNTYRRPFVCKAEFRVDPAPFLVQDLEIRASILPHLPNRGVWEQSEPQFRQVSIPGAGFLSYDPTGHAQFLWAVSV